ncbi:hypothetical protein [Pontibacter sp. H249]|uniref:hypothetical protein n=1 Tax=Pontibacter sp. H249 TaxID=3133420 RepID=UPI0030C11932
MKKLLKCCYGLLLAVTLPTVAWSQQTETFPTSQSRYVASASLGFNAVGLPGVSLQEQLKQVGVEAGVGRVLNKKGSLLATLNAGFGHTRYNGTKTYATANLEYAPTLIKNLKASITLGAGIAANTSPSDSWETNSNGAWSETSNVKLGPLLATSLGVKYKINNIITPTLRYQLLIDGNYNKSIPLLPTSVIQFGNQFSF